MIDPSTLLRSLGMPLAVTAFSPYFAPQELLFIRGGPPTQQLLCSICSFEKDNGYM
jgi:hypothetical protein